MVWLATDLWNIIIAVLVMIGGVLAAVYNYKRETTAKTKHNVPILTANILVTLAGVGSIISVVSSSSQREKDMQAGIAEELIADSIAKQRDYEAKVAILRLDQISDSLLDAKRDLTDALRITQMNLNSSREIRRAVTNVLHRTDTIYLVTSLRITAVSDSGAILDTLVRLDYLRHSLANARFYNGKETRFFFASTKSLVNRCRVVEHELRGDVVYCKLEIPLVREPLGMPERAYYEMSNNRIDINLNEGVDLRLPWEVVNLNLEFLDRRYVLDVPKRPLYSKDAIGAVHLIRIVGDISNELIPVAR